MRGRRQDWELGGRDARMRFPASADGSVGRAFYGRGKRPGARLGIAPEYQLRLVSPCRAASRLGDLFGECPSPCAADRARGSQFAPEEAAVLVVTTRRRSHINLRPGVARARDVLLGARDSPLVTKSRVDPVFTSWYEMPHRSARRGGRTR